MTHDDHDRGFPADELDRWLQEQTPPAPTPALVERCLATIPSPSVVPDLAAAPESRAPALWQYAAALAAAALLWINLSMSAVQATDFGYQRGSRYNRPELQPQVHATMAGLPAWHDSAGE